MKLRTARAILAVCAIITVSLSLSVAGAAIVWRLARLESRVDAVYAKVEAIEGMLSGTAHPKPVECHTAAERYEASLRR